ncbi:efflux RND transporter periplasmic adaptor subunit [Virgibacillus senegalensis]|uniref:efflux RND transporter periplasmic adaptor subunit n=1 Tax=Virgibacillus senegalensis TaxID=1499679 RepID=UPI00069FE727|nr:efflux RND transporter periplasmic adaptor subunit [Virgibacillus senegalensis]
MKKIVLPLLAFLVLVLAACSEQETDNAGEEESVTPVEVDEVTHGDLTIETQFYGRVTPESTAPVIPPTAGEVDSLEVEKGDQVEEGDVLATITSAEGRGNIDVEAPADGEVTSLEANEGGMVSNTEPLATIVDLDNLLIEVKVTAEDLALFEDNDEAEVQFADQDEKITGTIEYASPVPDDTGLYPVELSFENEDNAIKPGMTAVVRLPEKVVKDTLLVPTAALVDDSGESLIYLVEDDKAVEVPVEITETQSDVAAIEADVTEGDTVVIKGQLTLHDGGKVSIKKEEQ